MARLQDTIAQNDAHTNGELRAFRTELCTLAQTANDYPLEYALGEYDLLFESRDDIQLIVENLSESIAELPPAA